MKKHVMMAMLACSAALVVGCSSGSKETEKATEAKTEAKTEAVVATEAAEEEATEAATEAAETVEEAATEAAETVEEAATEAAEAVEEAATEAAEAVEEAVTEAAEELLSVAELIETEVETEEVEEAVETETAETEEAEELEAGVESVAESVDLEGSEEEETESLTEEETEWVIEELGARPEYTAKDYVTLGEYKGLEVSLTKTEITEDQVDQAITDAIASADAYEAVEDGTIEKGDIVNIYATGKIVDGDEFATGITEEDGGYDLEIGSGSFIEGFEDGLIGKKAGETVDLELTFPENYGSEDLAGKDVVFTVSINSVKRMPELTDEVATTLYGEDTTVDEYRAYQRGILEEQAEEADKALIENELMTQLYDNCEVTEYPVELVAYSVQEMSLYYQSYAQYYNMSFEEFITNYFGMDRETFNEQAEEAVKDSIRQELILNAIAEEEGLEVTDEEYEAGCEKYAESMGLASADELKANYDEAKIRNSLQMEEALDFVRENAVISYEKETESIDELVGDVLEVEEDTEVVTEEVTE